MGAIDGGALDAVKLHGPQCQANHSAREYPHQNRTAPASDQQRERHEDSRTGHPHRRLAQIAQRDIRGGIALYPAAPLQADKCDQQTDTHGNRVLQRVRNRMHQQFANAPDRHHQKRNTG
jgi:hypothetical protein